ncbi:DUF262 domain-containing protein [Serratia quinivorans]|uniref:DUF262 domain-containing protein n=1 Tax=Serratia quinivorans TaxID=137545 RepID=UPI00217869EB|nr:DUF262 domain-containing protein [Serratia quinivorans]CAI1782393.1 Protein of uncharacterised function DUF262 [Serratia quinivorans]CAI1852297.1 Protein of uncharacterised function DUF262 [Serratia quinivorans]
MKFEDVINTFIEMINIPLRNIQDNNINFLITDIDPEKKKLYIRTNNNKRLSSRTFKELEAAFNELIKTNYCNISQVTYSSDVVRQQMAVIFSNLPFVDFFHYESSLYLVLRGKKTHKPGVVRELPINEQRKVKKTISNFNKLEHSKFSATLVDRISTLHNEIEKIHILSPGLLADTKLRELLSDFDRISRTIGSATLQLDFNEDIDENFSEVLEDEDFDMADLVDLPYITGIDDGSNTDKLIDDDDDDDDVEIEISSKVPNIRRQTPSFSLLYERLLYNEIEIQPDYQRKDRIWSDDKKSKLIESILMGLPLPIFYFGERKNDNWVVIDGLQRLTTVQDFMQNKFPLKVEKNSSVFDANGLTFKEFNRAYTRSIREFEITAYVINIEGLSSNKFITELFHRINTYGVKLSEQEIRSAINFGPSVYYLKSLASSEILISATTNTINTKRQKDLELCLGALSFIIFGYKNYKNHKYNDFLSSAMRWLNNQKFKKEMDGEISKLIPDSIIVNEITTRFESSLYFCREVFGRDAFKKIQRSPKKEPISKPLFEVFVSLFANTTQQQKNMILDKKDEFKNCLYEAIVKDSSRYATWISQSFIDADRGINYALSNSTGKRVTILYRFESIINIIRETTGCILNIEPIAEVMNDY